MYVSLSLCMSIYIYICISVYSCDAHAVAGGDGLRRVERGGDVGAEDLYNIIC